MIIIGIGGNLDSRFGGPRESCAAALAALAARGLPPLRRSRFWRSAPVPVSDQPWFVNAVAALDCTLSPHRLLAILADIEEEFGRRRGAPNAARTLDLDLLDYRGWMVETDHLSLPHPRLQGRAFVLHPLAEIAPDWRHPRSRARLADLIAGLPADQQIEPL